MDGGTAPPGELTLNNTPFIFVSFCASSISLSTASALKMGPRSLISCKFAVLSCVDDDGISTTKAMSRKSIPIKC